MTAELGFDEREAAFLLDEPETSHAVKHLLEKAAMVPRPRARPSREGRLHSFDEEEDDGA
ncbi:MAG: hypothetical protein E6K11_02465 [Methanobacteriota archaeon]|nr:MAG: hypothetical protein E6K11_02465 [Euryarchaeota archaeon]